MRKITVIQVAKTKDTNLQNILNEYQKRFSTFFQYSEITVKTESDLWSKIPSNSFTIALEVEGKEYSSDQLAKFIQEKQNQGISHLVFLIGPAEGFSKYEKKVDMKLSLSKMTFSHQTIRMLLAEQLYRAYTIINNKPFAK